MFLRQKGLEVSFKEREGGTVTEGLRKGIPEFRGHGAERPATQGRKSSAGGQRGDCGSHYTVHPPRYKLQCIT